MYKKSNISNSDEFAHFDNLKITHKNPKEDIWKELSNSIEENSLQKKPKVLHIQWFKLAVAAIFLIGMGLSFMRFYSVEISTSRGELVEHILPDGSHIQLNAESSINYNPYWWRFNRELELEGEAFFEVEKGNKFQVNSTNGNTQVLGTSFNIYNRNEDYSVYCQTGKVKVSHHNSTQILAPGEFSLLAENELVKTSIPENEAISWKLNKFVYNTTGLDKVFDDFERHYNVAIEVKSKDIYNLNFTGIFDRSMSAEEAIEMMCLTFDLDYKKSTNFTYIIQKQSH